MLFRTNWSIPVPIPSLILPRIASGPIANNKDAATNPSTNDDSLLALNLMRSLSPKPSRRVSNLSREPIRPPMRSEPKTIRSVQPCGTACTYRSDHRGITADAAPRINTNPRTSVSSMRVFSFIRFPTSTPRVAPPTIATMFIAVPIPGNISAV